jgi:hypothetical protein
MNDREKIEWLLEAAGHKLTRRAISTTCDGRRYYFSENKLVRVIDYETKTVATPTETRGL